MSEHEQFQHTRGLLERGRFTQLLPPWSLLERGRFTQLLRPWSLLERERPRMSGHERSTDTG